ALLTDGTVRCWGRNQFGQLGSNGPGVSSSSPVVVSGFGGSIKSISSNAAEHSCAVLSNGTIQCWGSNFDGELGAIASDPAHDYSATPVTVSTLPGPASAVSANPDEFTCAVIASNGSLWCWGTNIWGNLGNGTSGSTVPQPAGPVTGLAAVSSISGGEDMMCAIVSGAAYCWGKDDDGQVGNGTMPDNGVIATP